MIWDESVNSTLRNAILLRRFSQPPIEHLCVRVCVPAQFQHPSKPIVQDQESKCSPRIVLFWFHAIEYHLEVGILEVFVYFGSRDTPVKAGAAACGSLPLLAPTRNQATGARFFEARLDILRSEQHFFFLKKKIILLPGML